MGLKSACACTIEAVDIHLVIVKKKKKKKKNILVMLVHQRLPFKK